MRWLDGIDTVDTDGSAELVFVERISVGVLMTVTVLGR